MELKRSLKEISKVFEEVKHTQSEFIVSCIDEHIFIKIPKDKQHFWSPQLHLELMEIDDDTSKVFAVFGPNPTVWTLFMFLHFLVAGLFIAFGIWAYSNWSLNNDYTMQLFGTIMMVVLWFALYLGGRMGTTTGKQQMHLLHDFMKKHLNL